MGKLFSHKVIYQNYMKKVFLRVQSSLTEANRVIESYVTITMVQITPDWNLQNFALQTRAMPDNYNITEAIKDAIIEWGLPTIPFSLQTMQQIWWLLTRTAEQVTYWMLCEDQCCFTNS